MRTPTFTEASIMGSDIGATPHEILQALERARVVGVLDAWANGGKYRHVDIRRNMIEWRCACTEGTHGSGYDTIHLGQGPTPDAARAAAAKAIEAGEV